MPQRTIQAAARPRKTALALPTASSRPAAANVSSFAVAPASTAPVVLSVRNLHKQYRNVKALDGVSLDLRKGEVLGFLGPNGAGKTTFTKCVVGFLQPSAGTVTLFGQNVHDDPRRILGRVGVVPDQYDFYSTLTGIQNLRFYARLYGIPEAQVNKRMESVLLLVGMSEHARRKVREYSHGMKQRLCIAQALIADPEFIIFDEPSNGLDPRGAYEVRELIKALSKAGKTIFLSSHVLSEVEQVCTRVAILSKGRVLVESSVAELRTKLKGGRRVVTITFQDPSGNLADAALRQGGVRRADWDQNRLVCELAEGHDVPDLVAALARAGGRIMAVQEKAMGLEEIFLELTRGQGGL